ncbi:MAG TPA: endonuclease/exonuclease/phosphatase family protein [Clostridia bacterium]|nr:endonuclease/exonuclease/phosphatase family protein [Clostridia bacterium]HOK82379.1 endonuclease/exonuclease/phosphatase family protein [Clostridia bacterium]HOL61527.1 endonuclease/exonuclease/phosphatase family protein [Clostridia bacterium]HPO53384.1 endonuclease/exonuclease/phosphatase family protein [Clostridia bacterium]
MKRIIKRITKIVIIVVLAIVLVAALGLGYFTIVEYNPKDIEPLTINNNAETKVELDTDIAVLTFNIGYAGLGKDEDFVLDGGKKSRPDSKDVVERYLAGIKTVLTSLPTDIIMLQEVDLDSRRSYNINEAKEIEEALGNAYSSTFAYNYNARFVPFPVSFKNYLGKVESGIFTLTKYHVKSSHRHQFPGAFAWPVRTVNLKRAMMVNVLPINNSDKELIVVNLHMSAYDGDGSLRAQEMKMLKDFLNEQSAKGNYVIVGGDFNQTFPEAKGIYPAKPGYYVAYPIEDDFLPGGYTFAIDTEKPSCRLLNEPYDKNSPNTQYYIIDGFIVSNNIKINNVDTIDLDFKYSDHNPVSMSIKLLS